MFVSINDGRGGSVNMGKEDSDARWNGGLRRMPFRGLCELRHDPEFMVSGNKRDIEVNLKAKAAESGADSPVAAHGFSLRGLLLLRSAGSWGVPTRFETMRTIKTPFWECVQARVCFSWWYLCHLWFGAKEFNFDPVPCGCESWFSGGFSQLPM
ncbi:hypothetical protein MJT46_005539 [Ovis ammon polii x Ovis aries]|nr:hypothetical protein MJT46_005539 [Ovis ammon polii x Ovis aries]